MKKTKFMTKVMAVVFALAILFAMSVPAWAAGDTTAVDAAPIISTFDTEPSTGYYKIPLQKTLIFMNKNDCSVYEPNIIYNYSVSAVDVTNATITDDHNPAVVAHVRDGVPSAIITTLGHETQAQFSSTNAAVTVTAADGGKATKTGYIYVNAGAFTSAGIYRYKITETTDATAKNNVGIVEGSTYSNTRYMDLYISNGTNGLELKNAVIYQSLTADDANVDVDTVKTPGFNDNSSSTSYNNETNADHYVTYNFSVKKEVSGTLADKQNEFPFYVAISNSISGAAFTYTKDGNESITGATVDGTTTTKYTLSSANFSVGSDASNSNLTLKHDDTITFTGVPSDTTNKLSIVVKEWNNTVDVYTATVSATGNTAPTITDGDLQANDITPAVTSAFDIVTNDIASQVIKLTNTITELSPTGLVFRVAPYVLMLAAGVSLIVLFAKRRREITDMI